MRGKETDRQRAGSGVFSLHLLSPPFIRIRFLRRMIQIHRYLSGLGFLGEWFKFIDIWLKVVALKLIVISPRWIGKLWMKFLCPTPLCCIWAGFPFLHFLLKLLPLANLGKFVEKSAINCKMRNRKLHNCIGQKVQIKTEKKTKIGQHKGLDL